ncbi:MAG TPA: hypothetical protein VL461_09080 [Dictyobacter sp.]|nr:hypothetical protein [Dictyobacter sp.]
MFPAMKSLPTTNILLSVGSWLPVNLGLTQNAIDSQMSTHHIFFITGVFLEFLFYALAAFWLARQPVTTNQQGRLLCGIWLITLLSGIIFLLAPATLSRDIYVYAGYGRVMVTHHANPYFVPLSNYPKDPFIPLDDWNSALSAYGPVWLLVCAAGSLVSGGNALSYILFYRSLGLLLHAGNTYLIWRMLHKTHTSPRTATVGTLLYGWNPLALQESIMGGHNDTSMVFCLLLGLWLCQWYDQRQHEREQWFTTGYGYLPAIVAFTLAALIKFTCLPVIGLFIIWLCFTQMPFSKDRNINRKLLLSIPWSRILRMIAMSTLVTIMLLALFYLPFWVGHSWEAIRDSFTSPPSAHEAYGSIEEAIDNWLAVHKQSHTTFLLAIGNSHTFWQTLTIIGIVCTLVCGAVWLWYQPTPQTLTRTILLMFSAMLTTTPWFFPWYVLWLISLAIASFSERRTHSGRALFIFAVVFSFTANAIYLFSNYAPLGNWTGWVALTTIGPPILLSLCSLLLPIPQRHEQAIL